MSGAWTKGPWIAHCQDVADAERPIGDSGVRFWDVGASEGPYRGSICTVHAAEHIGGIKLAERDANARLLAAAPDLYEVAFEALSAANELGISSSAFPREKIEAALVKARSDEQVPA